ncbi:hypothetical protein [Tychonema sp. LEGE 07203]|uniref:hypothetical protein n=1 Tax=Tychonema sp. LEGE 07203 TaxID=1828671 RepID=UPI00351C3A64
MFRDAIANRGGPTTGEAIRRRFGDTVTAIDRILTASSSVRLVWATDKLYNVRSILKDSRQLGDTVWERFKGKKDGTLWILSFFGGRVPPS